jgi:hypothetical protein
MQRHKAAKNFIFYFIYFCYPQPPKGGSNRVGNIIIKAFLVTCNYFTNFINFMNFINFTNFKNYFTTIF